VVNPTSQVALGVSFPPRRGERACFGGGLAIVQSGGASSAVPPPLNWHFYFLQQSLWTASCLQGSVTTYSQITAVVNRHPEEKNPVRASSRSISFVRTFSHRISSLSCRLAKSAYFYHESISDPVNYGSKRSKACLDPLFLYGGCVTNVEGRKVAYHGPSAVLEID
jgi:hypothetical protein